MGLYYKKTIRNAMQRSARIHSETRDGILWDVLPESRICRVRIQGSDTLISAHYPQNWESTPLWMKPGNAVRIVHRGGNRAKIEVVGHGKTIPTAIASGSQPGLSTTPNAVLTGMVVTSLVGSPSMAVVVYPGTFRIDDVIYETNSLYMGGDSFVMGSDIKMNEITATIAIDAAPSVNYYRYDIIALSADGVFDYIKGTYSSFEPTMPTTPFEHVKICHIFVYGGATAITQSMINTSYQIPVASQMTVVANPTSLEQELVSSPPPVYETDDTSTITITILNQFGNPHKHSDLVNISFGMGSGTLNNAVNGASIEVYIGSSNGVGTAIYKCTYADDATPLLDFELVSDSFVTNSLSIILYDYNGDVLY